MLLESTSPIGATARIAAILRELRPDLSDLAIATEPARRHPRQVSVVEPHLHAAPHGLDAPLLSLADALEMPGALLLLTDHGAFARIPPERLAGRRIIDTRGIFRMQESPDA